MSRLVTLGEVLRHRKGSITIDDTVDYKRCRVQLHRRGVEVRDKVPGTVIRTKKQQLCKTGDFIVAEMDAKFGGYGFLNESLDGAIVSSHYYLFEVIKERMLPEYLAVINKTDILQNQIKAKGSTNYSAVRPVDVLGWKIPLPSIAEQRRIIEQVEVTEKEQQLLLPEFEYQITHLTQLRQALLREAMQGQLLPQDPTDEPAALLLKKLQAAKAATGKGAKGKAGALFAEEAGAVKGLFSTPKDWLWCSLNQIASVSSGSTPKPDAFIEKGGVPYLKMYNLVNQNVGFDYRPQYIKEEVHNSLLKRSIARPGDLLMNIVGPPLGKLAIVPETFPEWNMNQAIVMITSSEKTTNKWIYWFLREGSAIATVELKGMAGQDNISVNQTRAFPIPLPPLAEQHRIVAKLEQLMQHCDALEQRIRESRRLAEQLLQTALREALAPPAGAEVAAEEITPEPHPRTHRGGAQLALTDLFE